MKSNSTHYNEQKISSFFSSFEAEKSPKSLKNRDPFRCGANKDNLMMHLCEVCKIHTREACTGCKLPFCSSSCMMKGVERHSQCFKMPELFSMKYECNTECSTSSQKSVTSNVNRTVVPFNKRNTNENKYADSNNGYTKFPRKNEEKYYDYSDEESSQVHGYRGINAFKQNGACNSPDLSQHEATMNENLKKKQVRRNYVSKSVNWNTSGVDSQLSKENTIEKLYRNSSILTSSECLDIVVTYILSRSEYYVMKKCDVCQVQTIVDLPRIILRSEPQLDSVYLSVYNGVQCRAKVVKKKPLTVLYIDYGNQEEVEVDHLFYLDKVWSEKRPLSFKIVLHPEPSEPLSHIEYRIKAKGDNRWELCDTKPSMSKSITAGVNSAIASEDKNDHVAVVEGISTYDPNTVNELPIILDSKPQVLMTSSTDAVVSADLVEQSNQRQESDDVRISNSSVQSSTNVVGTSVESSSAGKSSETLNKPSVEKISESNRMCTSVPADSEKSKFGSRLKVPLKVTIISCGAKNLYKVIRTEKKEAYVKLMENLEKDGSFFDVFYENDTVENMCAIDRDDIIHRVKISPNCPHRFEYVDDAKEGDLFEPEELLILPEIFKQQDLVPFSITLDIPEKLPKDKEIVIEQMKEVKPDLWCAKLVEEKPTYQLKTVEDFNYTVPKLPNLNHILRNISKDDYVLFVPVERRSEACFTGKLLSRKASRELMNLKKSMEGKVEHDYRPNVGELVMAYSKNTCFRGMILRETAPLFPSYSVLDIDCGYVIECKEFAHTPEKFTAIPTLSVTCNVQLPEGNEYFVDVITKYQVYLDAFNEELDSWSGTMTTQGKTCPRFRVEFVKHSPATMDLLSYLPLKTGDRVTLIPSEVFPRCSIMPTDVHYDDRRIEMLDLVNQKTSKSPLEEDPLRGDVVAVSHKSSLWRGAVLEKDNDKYFRVDLIDKGCEVRVRRKKMYDLPHCLKSFVRMTAPVVLKNVRTRESCRNPEITAFLKHEYEFELIVEEDSKVTLKLLKDVPYRLKINKCSTVNEYVDDLLTPDWLICLKNGLEFEQFKFKMDIMKSEIWNIGSTKLLYVAGIVEGDIEHNISVIDKDSVSQDIFRELNLKERVAEYCSYFHKPFLPTTNEICLAKQKSGSWERAVCLWHEAGCPPLLQFLDTGVIENVLNTNIRCIPTEFLNYLISAHLMKMTNKIDDSVFNSLVGITHRCQIISDTEIEILDLMPNDENRM